MGPLKWQQFCSQPLKNSRTRKEAGTTTTTKRLALHCKKKKRERELEMVEHIIKQSALCSFYQEGIV